MLSLSAELKVGLFTIVAGVLIGYMFFVLSPDSFNNDDYVDYITIVKDASGIIEKTHVKTNGVIVGKVSNISLESNRTKIRLSVKRSVKIPQGSSIAIKEKGLLGDVFIEIMRGDDVGVYIDPEGIIPPTEDQMSISALIHVAGAIGNDIKEITTILSKVMGGQVGERNIESIVSDFREFASNTRQLVEENKNDIRQIIQDIRNTSDTLKKVIANKEKDFDNIVSNVRLATADLKKFSSSIRDIVDGENRQKIDKIIASFDSTMNDVESTAKNVRMVAAKLENGQGSLGKLINDESTISELEGAIKDIREVLAPATKLQLTVDYHGELRKDESTQHYFNMYMRTKPDKFYLIGFTDLSESEKMITPVCYDKTDKEVACGSTDVSKTKDIISEKKALRFNFQFGKRWHYMQLRFGLFETTGGLASDFYLLDDRIKLTFEAFDWNSKSKFRKTAHFKTYLSILFFKHIYLLAGIDDPSRYDPETGKVDKNFNYFYGAGLNFDDQDLKAIFGTASLAL